MNEQQGDFSGRLRPGGTPLKPRAFLVSWRRRAQFFPIGVGFPWLFLIEEPIRYHLDGTWECLKGGNGDCAKNFGSRTRCGRQVGEIRSRWTAESGHPQTALPRIAKDSTLTSQIEAVLNIPTTHNLYIMPMRGTALLGWQSQGVRNQIYCSRFTPVSLRQSVKGGTGVAVAKARLRYSTVTAICGGVPCCDAPWAAPVIVMVYVPAGVPVLPPPPFPLDPFPPPQFASRAMPATNRQVNSFLRVKRLSLPPANTSPSNGNVKAQTTRR